MVDNILSSLKLLADPERIAFAERMFPTKLRVVGVTNPNLRLVLREVKADVKDWSPRAVIDLAHELLSTEVFEAHWLGYELVGGRKTYQQALTGADAGAMNRSLDNWVLTDVYAANVLGYAWREGLLADEWFTALSAHADPFQRRLPLVACAALNTPANGGTGDAKRTLRHCRLALGDKHPMVTKAMSWALRTLIRWDRAAVATFVAENEVQLSKLVVREVEEG